jgi:hypothetical protein
MTSVNDATSHPLAKHRNHLEFNGYRIEEMEDSIICFHPRKSNLFLKMVSGRGVLANITYSFKQHVGRLSILEYIVEVVRRQIISNVPDNLYSVRSNWVIVRWLLLLQTAQPTRNRCNLVFLI